MEDPIVIDPKNFDQKAAWGECQQYVDDCGGLEHENGEPNWRAAFGADPGCVSCPMCQESYWAWGKRQRCKKCQFEYPTDWWAMYSWGCQAAKRMNGTTVCPDPETNKRMLQITRREMIDRMDHSYYRYGFHHPVDDPWEEKDKIDWKQELSE